MSNRTRLCLIAVALFCLSAFRCATCGDFFADRQAPEYTEEAPDD